MDKYSANGIPFMSYEGANEAIADCEDCGVAFAINLHTAIALTPHSNAIIHLIGERIAKMPGHVLWSDQRRTEVLMKEIRENVHLFDLDDLIAI